MIIGASALLPASDKFSFWSSYASGKYSHSDSAWFTDYCCLSSLTNVCFAMNFLSSVSNIEGSLTGLSWDYSSSAGGFCLSSVSTSKKCLGWICGSEGRGSSSSSLLSSRGDLRISISLMSLCSRFPTFDCLSAFFFFCMHLIMK